MDVVVVFVVVAAAILSEISRRDACLDTYSSGKEAQAQEQADHNVVDNAGHGGEWTSQVGVCVVGGGKSAVVSSVPCWCWWRVDGKDVSKELPYEKPRRTIENVMIEVFCFGRTVVFDGALGHESWREWNLFREKIADRAVAHISRRLYSCR